MRRGRLAKSTVALTAALVLLGILSPTTAQAAPGWNGNAAKVDPQLWLAAGVPGASSATSGDVRRHDGGKVSVVVSGAAAEQAVREAGGTIITTSGTKVGADVDPAQLARLSDVAAVSGVKASSPAKELAITTNEAVNLFGAPSWYTQGQGGDGAVVAIVDAGFKNLDAETTSGNLPSGLAIKKNYCGAGVNNSVHGTAVSEIVHQIAPGAQIVLYCVRNSVDFVAAAQDIVAAGIKIVTSSLGFSDDARGDGVNDDPMSASYGVKYANQNGVFWIQSAGNSGDAHYGSTFPTSPDSASSSLITLVSDTVTGSPGAVELTFDQWTGTPADVRVCTKAPGSSTESCSSSGFASAGSPFIRKSVPSGSQVSIKVPANQASSLDGVAYDLVYDSGWWAGGPTTTLIGLTQASRSSASRGSVTAPANSPYAFAVGAIDADNPYRLEDFSSQGPTIDGRTKPDIAGYDNLTSTQYPGGFLGTSAAAPSVAGLAALVYGANPNLSVTGLKSELTDRAVNTGLSSAFETNTADKIANQFGAGRAAAGTATAPATSRYVAVDPVRIRDTRAGTGPTADTGIGGTVGALASNSETVVPLPASVPATATSAVVTLTGVGATASTFLAAYPRYNSGTSNLNLSTLDPIAAVTVTVSLYNGTFRVYNKAGSTDVVVDLVGYYDPAAGGAGYKPITPVRALDTRPAPYHVGGVATRKLNPGEVVNLPIAGVGTTFGIPTSATAVIVNLTVTNLPPGQSGFVSAYPTLYNQTSSLNFRDYDRAGLAIVPLGGTTNKSIKLQNSTTYGFASIDLVVDIVGYYDGASGAGSSFVARTPNRVIDTRIPLGTSATSVNAGQSITLNRASVVALPAGISGLAMGVVAISPGVGFLNVYPSGGVAVANSAVNFTADRVVPNATITGLSGGSFSVYSSANGTAVVADVFGYFIG